MGNMLINVFLDDTLVVSKRLAAKVGLNEALFLQQIHYWLERSTKVIDGRKWVYNSSSQWAEQLPFFSSRTIERIIKSLKEKGLIIVSSHNKKSFDRTNWYSIDYDALNRVLNEIIEDENKKCEIETDKMAVSETDKLSGPIPENTTENTTENNSRIIAQTSQKSSEPPADVAAIPLNDGTEWTPTMSLAKEYIDLYPNVDVKQAFNAMRAWCMSNPSRRKTRRGITAFVNRWLSKEQDSGRPKKQEKAKHREEDFEYLYS